MIRDSLTQAEHSAVNTGGGGSNPPLGANFCRWCGKSFVVRGWKNKIYCSRKCGIVVAVSRRRQRLKTQLVEAHGGCCVRCGYNKYVGALDFHHRDPAEKEFALSQRGLTKSFGRLYKESLKCDLLCANCHREVHSNVE